MRVSQASRPRLSPDGALVLGAVRWRGDQLDLSHPQGEMDILITAAATLFFSICAGLLLAGVRSQRRSERDLRAIKENLDEVERMLRAYSQAAHGPRSL